MTPTSLSSDSILYCVINYSEHSKSFGPNGCYLVGGLGFDLPVFKNELILLNKFSLCLR